MLTLDSGPATTSNELEDMLEEERHDSVFDPYSFPLQPDETLVVPHPFSGKEPYVFKRGSEVERLSTGALRQHLSSDGTKAWFPFRTRQDFEQAELFILSHCSNRHIDQQLQLIKQHCPKEHAGRITLSSAREMHELLRLKNESGGHGAVRMILLLSCDFARSRPTL